MVPGNPDLVVPGNPDLVVSGNPDLVVPGMPALLVPGNPDLVVPGKVSQGKWECWQFPRIWLGIDEQCSRFRALEGEIVERERESLFQDGRRKGIQG